MKLKVFTKAQWKKKRKEIEDASAGDIQLAFDDGFVEGQKAANEVLVGAVYRLMIMQDPGALTTITVGNKDIGRFGYVISRKTGGSRIELYDKGMLPDEEVAALAK